jgi:hypothetical protein
MSWVQRGAELTSDFDGYALGSRFDILVLPDPDHAPPGSPETLVRVPITCSVALDLRGPVASVPLWPSHMERTAVPKATVNEYREPSTKEDDVGPHAQVAGYHGMVDPVAQPASVQRAAQAPLGASITAAIGLHDLPRGG